MWPLAWHLDWQELCLWVEGWSAPLRLENNNPAVDSQLLRPQWVHLGCKSYVTMDQYLYIPFLAGWTSIYQLFWCSPGVQGFDTLPCKYTKLEAADNSFPIKNKICENVHLGTQTPAQPQRLPSILSGDLGWHQDSKESETLGGCWGRFSYPKWAPKVNLY